MNNLEVAKFYEPLVSGLVSVPAIQPGVCPVCRAAVKPGFDDCYRCSGEPTRVLPISMSVHGGLLHHHLRNYKDGPVENRDTLTLRLAAIVEIFLRHHLDRCLGGPVDLVATVPSVRRDAPWGIVARLQRFEHQPTNPLRYLPSASGGTQLSVVDDVGGRRVLLLDDTFTTGESMFRAAHKLQHAGAIVVGPVAVGRHVRETFIPSRALLDCLRPVPWAASRCGVCSGVVCRPPLVPPTQTTFFP